MSDNRFSRYIIAVGMLATVGLFSYSAYAAPSAPSTITQAITAGTISTDIRDASNAVVGSPSFAMAATSVSTSQQTTTGMFGSSTQRLSVDNPGATLGAGGWTLSLNATVPGTGKWTSGGLNYSYNGLPAAGQLTVDPSVSTITPVVGAATGVTKGTSAAFTGSTAITLMTASAASDDIWNGYMTGVGLSQIIPAAQAAGNYTINMTQTVVGV